MQKREISYSSENYNPLKRKREAEAIREALYNKKISPELARKKIAELNFII